MDTKRVNIFVFDSKENFSKSQRSLATEGRTCKRLILVEDADEFDRQLATLDDDDLVFLVVHVFATENIKGLKEFKASAIIDEYPRLQTAYVSDGIETDIKHKMVDANIDFSKIYKYHSIVSGLRNGELKAIKKSELKEINETSNSISHGSENSKPQSSHDGLEKKNTTHAFIEESTNIAEKGLEIYDYAVLTALYKHEFTELEKFFDFNEADIISDNTNRFNVGYSKANKKKKIIVATQVNTGMVDASVMATIMIEKFKPKYMIMTGVCGGLPTHNFGDIIVASKVYTFQKGKVNNITIPKSNEPMSSPFVNEKGETVDLDRIYTIDGHNVAISAEEFEKESESAGTLQIGLHKKIEAKSEEISDLIMKKVKNNNFFKNQKQISISISPMACSTMVINKGGYFEKNIKVIERKVAAVEMESYGVARACDYANEGKTIPIIFKAVMDKTVDKSDTYGDFDAKKFAAYTSAYFLSLLLELDII
jgi:nucleoside phosphorylase